MVCGSALNHLKSSILPSTQQMTPVLHTTHRYYFPRRTLLPNQPQTTASTSNTEYRSNDDSAMTSSSVQGISQLPDVFPGVLALLWECGQEERTLTRYIVAYGGDICSCMEEGPTHIVCGNDRDLPQVRACFVCHTHFTRRHA